MLLLIETHRKLLWLWLSATVLLLALVLIQHFNGLFQGIESTPWQWVGICLLPAWMLLLAAMKFKPNPEKIVLKSVFWVIFAVSATYLLLLLFTWYGMRAGATEQGLKAYFEQTYRWLLPSQALVLGIYGLLFLKKDGIFQPNGRVLHNPANTELKTVRTTNNLSRQQALQFLTGSEHTNLFLFLHEKLSENSLSTDKQKDLTLLENQFNRFNHQKVQGLLDPIVAERELNRVNEALLDLINKLWVQL